MTRRVLFLIRDKLGDTLVAAAVALAYARAHPDDDLQVMVRAAYAPLLAGETSITVVRYRSSVQAYAWALLSHLPGRGFDALAVLRGFGDKVARFGRLVNARRKLHNNPRFAAVFPEFPPPPPGKTETAIIDASWRVARLLDPALPKPDRLELAALRQHREAGGARFAGICPITDESRKNLSAFAVRALVERIRRDHPGLPIRILVRRPGEGGFGGPDFEGVPVVAFRSIARLVREFSAMALYFGADTGLYHLAVGMGIPAQVVFGPTQPWKILLPAQDACGWRVAGLDERECDEKTCMNPRCVDQAAANLVAGGGRGLVATGEVPSACPLLPLIAESLKTNSRYTLGRLEMEPQQPVRSEPAR